MKKCVLVCFVALSLLNGFSSEADSSLENIDALLKSFAYSDDHLDESIVNNLKVLTRLGYAKFPSLYVLYERNKLDKKYVHAVVSELMNTDGNNIVSRGDSRALNITRDVLKSATNEVCLPALIYLAQKGNANDIPLLQKACLTADPYLQAWARKMLYVLESRISGTNMIQGVQKTINIGNISETRPGFIPSVANTGPQVELVFQRVKEELAKVNGDVKKLPPELLTLTIPPPQPVGEWFKGKSWLIGAGVLLLAAIGVLMFRKTRKP